MMPLRQEGFSYSAENIQRLEASLSTERFSTYLSLAQQDSATAISLYEWNTAISESLYGMLQGLEIALRNSLHRILANGFNRADWYEVLPLHIDQHQAVADAKRKLISNRRPIEPCRMVAELTFGFWTALTGPRYAQTLWDKHLCNAFPNARISRKTAQKRLRKIRYLRNRIAHHECIIGNHPDGSPRNLEQDERDILDTISWICPVTASWVRSNSSFRARFEQRPRPPESGNGN